MYSYLGFRGAKILPKNLDYDFFDEITNFFPNKPSSKAWVKCKLTQLTFKVDLYMDLK